MKNMGSWFVFTVTAGLIALFLYNNRQVFDRLGAIEFADGVWLLGFAMLAPIFNAFKFYFACRAYSFVFAYKECFSLVASCSLYNYILPSNAGSVIRAIYLKKVFAFPYCRYVSMTLFANLVSLLVSLGCVLLLIFWVDFKLDFPYLPVLVVLLLLCLVVGYLMLNNHGFRHMLRSKLDVLPEFDGHFLYGSVGLVASHVAFVVISALRMDVSFQIMGVDLALHHYVLIQSILAVALVYNLTPGNIGVAEGGIASLMLMFGVDMVTSFSAALIDRFIIFVVLGVFGSISIGHLDKLKSSLGSRRRREPA